MRAGLRGHLSYANVMASIAVFVALGGGAYAATSSFVAGNGTIRGCVSKHGGTLQVVKAGKKCPKRTVALSFNQTGPKGTQGAAGAAGSQGPAGPAGSQGPAGISGQTRWGNVLVAPNAPNVVLAQVGPFTISAHCNASGDGSELLSTSSAPAQVEGEDSGYKELKTTGESAEIGDDEDYDEAFYAWSSGSGASLNGNTFLWNKEHAGGNCEFQGVVTQTS